MPAQLGPVGADEKSYATALLGLHADGLLVPNAGGTDGGDQEELVCGSRCQGCVDREA